MTTYWMEQLIDLLISIPGLLLCLSVHEAAHGLTAYKLGDPTAKSAGRLTLNPFQHLDVIGTLCLLFFHVGWAKPVPVNSRYFKKPRRDIALVSLAGPISNFLLAFVLLFVRQYLMRSSLMPVFVLGLMAYYGAVMSIGLGVFNLIPIPPLDGSKILMSFLPWEMAVKYTKYEQYIQFALLLLLFFGVLNTPLNFCINHIYSFLCGLLAVLPV
ncbi:MAG: site-2 protease family protein [Butyricicoccus sp.]